MAKTVIPKREEVPVKDRWNLSKLYESDEAWEQDLKKYESLIPELSRFKGTLENSGKDLLGCLEFLRTIGMLDERLNYYSNLRQTEDEGSSSARDRAGRYLMTASRCMGAMSFFEPEILSIQDGTVSAWAKSPEFGDFRVYLDKILRRKPHVLSEKEEKLLALQVESNQTAQTAFSILTNVDLDFGTVTTPEGERPLSNGSWISFMQNPDREIRKNAYVKFYAQFDKHKNTLAALFSGSVQLDKYQAQVRGFASAREAALFPDNVDETVYDTLVSTVGANLKPLHDYYELKKRILKVPELRHWDVYAPFSGAKTLRHTWEQAVETIDTALIPLGDEYRSTLKSGLLGGWADRYENKGKRSGAFSAGSFSGDPYILMNFYEDNIRDVFTLAHEGGHSMHSWYSMRSNPFMHYNYTIFEAEVASTFNEELLFRSMTANCRDSEIKAYLVSKRVDDILSTLYRQTMFAEYEKITHALMEGGTPLTLDVLRAEYRKLLEKYFGPAMVFEETSDLEGLRIPHFYSAFYVYKYATGISASLALAEKVLSGGKKERDDYFAFLKSGGSRFPIESLHLAGVDMSKPEPIQAACSRFALLVEELKSLL